MKKRRVLKNYVSFILYFINTVLVLLDTMLIAELNTCLLFYSISINIIVLNTYIIHKYGSSKFNYKYMYILKEN
ncbi:MAG: hypothetical protein MST00_06555 [Tenericutes bacterium]|nr:hypothetical protein [Mycoplasmatota bacterium]